MSWNSIDGRRMVLAMIGLLTSLPVPVSVLADCDAQPAVAEKKVFYSIVGKLDWDSDGISDRNDVRKMIKAVGAGIDNEVDSKGIRKPADGRITVRTKMLIVGELPNPEVAPSAEERESAKRILKHYRTMREEAREAGVGVVRFSDFFRFGSPRRRSRIRDNDSNTTGILRPSTKLRQRATGQTSGIYSRKKARSTDDNP